MTLLVDTHVLQWWTAEPDRLSSAATTAIEASEDIAVSAISWWELAWLAAHGRISVAVPIRTWLADLARDITTIAITPEIAETAVALPAKFPGDPADRLIYATAIETGARLVTKDRRLRAHPHPRRLTIW